ncbi:F-box/kelch-repeat protein At3g23880-like [Salvia hispanica]|uniref:F-box/kelch-repeat protein At3g23880-like n=1 Tax=Salvia hispanica TaxID=49212 RepID=UPI00200917BA|nr:F-box/kelch-repeat protein At3g23880-like [Salvia hispanica]
MGYASLVNADAKEDRSTISFPSRRASLVVDPVIQINIDVLIEILLCLPVQSILRFRAVCKSWGHIIDSPSFRTLHTRNNKSDDTVTLQVYATNFSQNKLSIKFQHNGKSLMSYEAESLTHSSFKLVGAVKGLICINPNKFRVPIAICNPSLGQLKLLPLTIPSTSKSCGICWREVAIGFDEDYKVVQLMSCPKHRHVLAQVYSRRTGSWRELARDDGGLLDTLHSFSPCPIKSWCKNGYFAHWRVYRLKVGGRIVQKILSLDMKNEVFHTIRLPADYTYYYDSIFADDERSFRRFVLHSHTRLGLVGIYESRCERSELSWNHMMDVEVPFSNLDFGVSLWRSGCVFIKYCRSLFVYDYRAHKFICKHVHPAELVGIIEYSGSFVSLEN